MPSTIAIIEHHCVRNKSVVEDQDKVIAIINITPRDAYADRDNLAKIAEATRSFNKVVLNDTRPTYSIEVKEIKENDYELYQDLCNEILTDKKRVDTFSSLSEFNSWYRKHLTETVAKQVGKEKEISKYVSDMRKKPLK